MAATHPGRLHQATDVIKRCPIWCVEEHTAHASITQLMTDHKPNVYVPIVVEVEMTPAELTSLTDDLEKFAACLRTYSKEHPE